MFLSRTINRVLVSAITVFRIRRFSLFRRSLSMTLFTLQDNQEQGIKRIYLQKCILETQLLHTHCKNLKDNEIVPMICDLVRKGGNWDDLTGRLDIVELNDSIVEQILLELKDTKEAKLALSFFHWSALRKNCKHGVRPYCIIVQILVRAQLLTHARALLESAIRKHCEGVSDFKIPESLVSTYGMTSSSPQLFDFLMQTYTKLRMFEVALSTCYYLEKHGFCPSLITWNTFIHFVQKSDQNNLVWKLYEDMIKKRTYPNAITIRIMVDAMCKEGTMQKSVDFLDKIHKKRCTPGVIVNATLVSRIVEEGRIEDVIILLKRMLQKNMILDDVAYSLIIYGHCKKGNLKCAHRQHKDMLKKGYPANSFIYTSLIGAHCTARRIQDADCLMQEMLCEGLKPYEETYNYLIEGFSSIGRLEESLAFYKEMFQKGFLPSLRTCNELLRQLCKVGNVNKANNILTGLLDKGFLPDEVTYCHLMDGYGKEFNAQEVLKLYYEMEYRGPFPGRKAYTSLIRSLCRCGKLQEAEIFLNVMETRSLVPTTCVYNLIIAQKCTLGDMGRALSLYNEMIKKGSKPDSHTFAMLVKGISNLNMIQDANKMLDKLKSFYL